MLVPEDVRAVFRPVMAHRIFLDPVYELRRDALVASLRGRLGLAPESPVRVVGAADGVALRERHEDLAELLAVREPLLRVLLHRRRDVGEQFGQPDPPVDAGAAPVISPAPEFRARPFAGSTPWTRQ